MSDKTDRGRRRFLATSVMSIAAAQLGVFCSASGRFDQAGSPPMTQETGLPQQTASTLSLPIEGSEIKRRGKKKTVAAGRTGDRAAGARGLQALHRTWENGTGSKACRLGSCRPSMASVCTLSSSRWASSGCSW